VNGQRIAEELVSRGLDASSIDGTARLYDAAISAFRRIHPSPPRHASWVPGRLEVFGKHTDYAGGRTLIAAMPRGFAFVASPRNDDVVHVVDARDDEDVRLYPVEASGILPAGAARTLPVVSAFRQTTFTGWRHYAAVVVARLARNFPGARLGADIVFASNLPRASGMSSSSALVVGLASALVRLGNIRARHEWRANVPTAADAAGYFACIENGMTFGELAGDSGVGTHGGSEDHVAMICGVAGELSAYSFVPIRHLTNVAMPADWRFVIASSGVRAEKTGSARHAYNRLSEGVSTMVRLWNTAETPALSLATIASSPAALARLRRIVRTSDVPGWTRDALERRLDHFVREDARVGAAVEAFSRADRSTLGELASASQRDALDLLANQVPETVALARTALDRGAFAACSFGAGFGGSVWALADTSEATTVAEVWSSAAFIADPSGAATEIV
jgi:galactokinase